MFRLKNDSIFVSRSFQNIGNTDRHKSFIHFVLCRDISQLELSNVQIFQGNFFEPAATAKFLTNKSYNIAIKISMCQTVCNPQL